MLPFDPQDWWGPDQRKARKQPDDPDLDRMLLCGLATAACLCLASFVPAPLMPLVAAELLMLAALGSMMEGVLRGERLIGADRLTAWDQAAALAALALLLRFLFPDAAPEAAAP
jgi:hypothetical protein